MRMNCGRLGPSCCGICKLTDFDGCSGAETMLLLCSCAEADVQMLYTHAEGSQPSSSKAN